MRPDVIPSDHAVTLATEPPARSVGLGLSKTPTSRAAARMGLDGADGELTPAKVLRAVAPHQAPVVGMQVGHETTEKGAP